MSAPRDDFAYDPVVHALSLQARFAKSATVRETALLQIGRRIVGSPEPALQDLTRIVEAAATLEHVADTLASKAIGAAPLALVGEHQMRSLCADAASAAGRLRAAATAVLLALEVAE